MILVPVEFLDWTRMPFCAPFSARRPLPHWNKLFPAIHTKLLTVATTIGVFFPIAHFHGNLAVHHLAAHWTKTHLRVGTPMINIGTALSSSDQSLTSSPSLGFSYP
jgi:hypothetical protein